MLYSVMLVTRLRRRVFNGGAVRQYTSDVLREASGYSHTHIHLIDYGEDCVFFEIESDPSQLDPCISSLRSFSSGRIRQRFPEFHSMPSFWMKKYFAKPGPSDDDFRSEALSFLHTLPTR